MNTLITSLFTRKTLRRAKNSRRWERGVAAIEAALILPVIAFMIVGFMELYQYYRAITILDRTAFTVANGLSIQRELYDREPCDKSDHICTYGAVAGDLLAPLDYRNNGQVILSLYAAIEPTRPNQQITWKQSHEWQRAYQGGGIGSPGRPAASSRLQTTDFPIANQGDTIIAVEMFYDYEPFVITSRFWQALGGERRVYTRALFRPRFSDIRAFAS